jgi:hypothetical protein
MWPALSHTLFSANAEQGDRLLLERGEQYCGSLMPLSGVAPQANATLVSPFRLLSPCRGTRAGLVRKRSYRRQGLRQVIEFMGEAGLLKVPLPAPDRFVELKYLGNAGVK